MTGGVEHREIGRHYPDENLLILQNEAGRISVLLYVVILYDERDDVRRAEVLSAETEAGAVEQAHRIALAAPGYNGYELWLGGHKVATHFFKPRVRSGSVMPPDGQQSGFHLHTYPQALQLS